jgi:hypothetical protein
VLEPGSPVVAEPGGNCLEHQAGPGKAVLAVQGRFLPPPQAWARAARPALASSSRLRWATR